MYIFKVHYYGLSKYTLFESLDEAMESVLTIDFGCEGIRPCTIEQHKLPYNSDNSFDTIVNSWTKYDEYGEWLNDYEVIASNEEEKENDEKEK